MERANFYLLDPEAQKPSGQDMAHFVGKARAQSSDHRN